MARRVLDLNTYERPTLELTLQDEARTKIVVTMPTEGLVRELEHLSPEVVESLAKGDQDGVAAAYDLAAKLISCNSMGLQLTAADLREKYRMGFESMIIFFSAYLDFIEEITNAKN